MSSVRGAASSLLSSIATGEREHRKRHGHIHEQHPPPAQELGDHTPSTIPKTNPTPAIAPYTPIARFRSSPSAKVVATSASEAGTSAAPPTPCNRRAATSTQGAHASPPSSEAAANKASPDTNRRRRP